jgi:nickel-dependent lactate racemase
MTEIGIPFGETVLRADIKDRDLLAIVTPRWAEPVHNFSAEIQRSLNEPIGKEKLSKIVSPNDDVVIVVDDVTRPIFSPKVLPVVLRELKQGGVALERITVLVATGSHRQPTDEEKAKLIGPDLIGRLKVVGHDARDKNAQVNLGKTKRGIPILINRIAVDADIRVCLGYVGLHASAGYTGGKKSIMPGIAGLQSILVSHGFELGEHPTARSGVIEGNVFREELEEASDVVGIDFIVNVVLGRSHMEPVKNLLRAFSGDALNAHRKAVDYYSKMVRVDIPSKADIVVTSAGGYPHDRNLYMALRGPLAAYWIKEPVIKKGGIFIVVAECRDGLNRFTESFELLMNSPSPGYLVEAIRSHRYDSIDGIWNILAWAELLQDNEVILVTKAIPKEVLRRLFIKQADSLDQAIEMAKQIAGRDSKILVMPQAPETLPILES